MVFFLVSFFSCCALANPTDLSQYFQGKSGCFILFDLNKNQLVTRFNPSRCSERIAPDSTFKIPLSLMAFDQKLIKEDTVFKWDGRNKGFTSWNQNQTPQTWFQNSTVWVSQGLTPKLGIPTITNYLKEFSYGNHDFSGDRGENNGLTHAWLSSSLKLSANEQLLFLQKFAENKLPVSNEALTDTKNNMYLETSHSGWKLYGKTGSGIGKTGMPEGWFVGYVEKGSQRYEFVLNFTDLYRFEPTEAAGMRAKEIAKAVMTNLNVYG